MAMDQEWRFGRVQTSPRRHWSNPKKSVSGGSFSDFLGCLDITWISLLDVCQCQCPASFNLLQIRFAHDVETWELMMHVLRIANSLDLFDAGPRAWSIWNFHQQRSALSVTESMANHFHGCFYPQKSVTHISIAVCCGSCRCYLHSKAFNLAIFPNF